LQHIIILRTAEKRLYFVKIFGDTMLAMENMKRTKTTPADEAHWLLLRKPNLGSTDVAALFGLSPFNTYAEKWLEKRDCVETSFKGNDRTEAGQILEPAIAQLIAKREGWTVKPFKDYMSIDGLRLGSSFDYVVLNEDGTPRAILEIKNVDAKNYKDWHNEDGELEAKKHIELQLQTQMLVSGIHEAYIGVLFGGNNPKVLHRKYDPAIGEVILNAVNEFWRKVDENEQPQFDYSNPKDQEVIKKLYREGRPPVTMDATKNTELASLYAEYTKSNKAAKLEKEMADSLKAKITTTVGEASLIVGDGWAFTLKEQEYGDWTALEFIYKDKELIGTNPNTMPQFGDNLLVMLDNGNYALSELNNNGQFVIDGSTLEAGKVVAWSIRPDYKPKTISRVLRDKKIKSAKPNSTNFDVKID